MRRIALLALVVGSLTPLLASAPAHAQATRTWVSGVGDDVNPCSRTAPCKTFAGAISKTAAAGEINCIDPAGYGTITITKSMTLNCPYTLGSILASGVPGVTINGAGAVVVLRGLQITGVSGGTAVAGTIGVRILQAATVSIEDTVITQFAQQGIVDTRSTSNTKLFIKNSVITHNVGTGIALTATGAGNKTNIENTSSVNNLFGIAVGTSNSVMVRRSVLSQNNTGIEADGGGQANVVDSSIDNNGTGVQATASNIRLSNSDIMFSTVNGLTGNPVSYGNNRVFGNAGVTATTGAGAGTTDLGQQ